MSIFLISFKCGKCARVAFVLEPNEESMQRIACPSCGARFQMTLKEFEALKTLYNVPARRIHDDPPLPLTHFPMGDDAKISFHSDEDFKKKFENEPIEDKDLEGVDWDQEFRQPDGDK